jgi:hypothetical protein
MASLPTTINLQQATEILEREGITLQEVESLNSHPSRAVIFGGRRVGTIKFDSTRNEPIYLSEVEAPFSSEVLDAFLAIMIEVVGIAA